MTKISIVTKLCYLVLCCFLFNNCKYGYKQKEIRLAGTWDLALDSLSTGPGKLTFNKTIELPGTLGESSIGDKLVLPANMTRRDMFELGWMMNFTFEGKAWYRKTIRVPSWAKDKTIIMTLERVIWKSTIYIDGKEIGWNNSLSVPQRFDLTGKLDPGKHEIMICVDNTSQFNIGGWTKRYSINEIMGDFNISFFEKSYITKISLNPDEGNMNLKIRIFGQFEPANEQINFKLKEKDSGEIIATSEVDIDTSNKYNLGINTKIREWNEFDPSLYVLESSLIKNGKLIQTHSEVFGFRRIESSDKQIKLNGKPIFLRGAGAPRFLPPNEHSITDPGEWEKIFGMARAYGINHFRFHSHTPPEAAFEVADKMGIYLQVECPIWSLSFGKDTSDVRFITEEAHRIITEYGNHPSFCMMTMGNEMEGDYTALNKIVEGLKAIDNRRLYAATSFTFQKGHGRYPEPVDDFLVTQYTDSGYVRGQGFFDFEYPRFDQDYLHTMAHIPVPLITHEVGQHTVFPDLRDINKCTGVYRMVSYEDIKADLEKKGLLSKVNDFINASGNLQVLLYKEDIERALKTSGISGFQLLDLYDIIGNSAVVGVLSTFWEPKEYIDSTEFRQFCSEMVPLAWFGKSVYSNTDTFDVEVGVANFFRPLENLKLICELSDNAGNILQSKELAVPEIDAGKTKKYGQFEFVLADMKVPMQCKLTLKVDGTKYRNSWPIWVYPEKVTIVEPEILTTASFEEAEKALNEGKRVLLSPPLEKIKGNAGRFITIFWSPTHFGGWQRRSQIGTLGLLIDPKHPAFESFPTEFHSNWQWWDLCRQSESLEIDSVDVQPLLTVIDNYFKNRRLTNLFEAKVGNGKLIFSSIDLVSNLDQRIEARQLRYSLLEYMKSSQFNPQKSITMQSIQQNFKDKNEVKSVRLRPYD